MSGWTAGSVHHLLLAWGQRVARERIRGLGYPRRSLGHSIARATESLAPADVTLAEFDRLEAAIAALAAPLPRALVLYYAPDAYPQAQLPEGERGQPLTQQRIARIVGLPRATLFDRLDAARACIARTLNASEGADGGRSSG